MKDILCRLTESREWLSRDGFITSARNASDAADEIKQLRAEVATLKEQLAAAQKDADSKQVRIDELMLEYCPDEMMPEQIEEWAKHQVPDDSAITAQEVKS